MKEEYKELFGKLGYNVDGKCAVVYGALLDDIRDLVSKGTSDEEIKSVFPSYCLELYHFFFEITRLKFFNYLNEFKDSPKKNKIKDSKKLLDMGLNPNIYDMELYDSLVYFAKYFEKNKVKTEGLDKGIK